MVAMMNNAVNDNPLSVVGGTQAGFRYVRCGVTAARGSEQLSLSPTRIRVVDNKSSRTFFLKRGAEAQRTTEQTRPPLNSR